MSDQVAETMIACGGWFPGSHAEQRRKEFVVSCRDLRASDTMRVDVLLNMAYNFTERLNDEHNVSAYFKSSLFKNTGYGDPEP